MCARRLRTRGKSRDGSPVPCVPMMACRRARQPSAALTSLAGSQARDNRAALRTPAYVMMCRGRGRTGHIEENETGQGFGRLSQVPLLRQIVRGSVPAWSPPRRPPPYMSPLWEHFSDAACLGRSNRKPNPPSPELRGGEVREGGSARILRPCGLVAPRTPARASTPKGSPPSLGSASPAKGSSAGASRR